jgi:prenyl protein peptidase
MYFLQVILATVFVALLYVAKGNRNDDIVIKKRTIASFISCLIGFLIVRFHHNSKPLQTVFELLGWNFQINAKLLFSVVILFSGSIYHDYHTNNFNVQPIWISIRNYIVAPIVEEIVFRSCMIALMKQDHSAKEIIFISPLFFGLAHLHHGYRVYTENGSDSFALKKAILVTIVQFSYTTIFGMYSAFCLLKSGIVTCILIHVFCNFMGLPDFTDFRIHVPGLLGFVLINWV